MIQKIREGYEKGHLVNTMRQEREIKGILIGKKETKLSLLTDDMIVYAENPKQNKIKKPQTLELVSKYSKFARYKVNIQKSITLLQSSNEQVKFEI